jgi:hypothetical protein
MTPNASGFTTDAAVAARPNENDDYVKFSDKLTESLSDITRMLNEHKVMIDAIQEVGIQLTSSFKTLHRLTVRYAGIVNAALDALLPWLRKVPLMPQRFVETAETVERVTQRIIDSNVETAQTIADVNAGLKLGDVNRLRGHTDDLQKITKLIGAILPDKD